MNYRVRREGVELGTFPVEELRRRRAAGELTGREYVQAEGRKDWQQLDLFLQVGDRVLPAQSPTRQPANPQPMLWLVVSVSIVIFLVLVGFVAFNTSKIMRQMNARNRTRTFNTSTTTTVRSEAAKIASRPVHWTTNTLAAIDVRRADEKFDRRQWLENYQQHGRHDAPWDGLTLNMLDAWFVHYYGVGTSTNLDSLQKLTDDLARQTNCDDPLALTISGISSAELFAKARRLERAMKSFEHSSYRAYPKFVAAVQLAAERTNDFARLSALDSQARDSLRLALTDGSVTPADQPIIAELLVNGWGSAFFKRNADVVVTIAQNAGKDYEWLALVLGGENHINQAWKARGSGYSDSVTTDGWKGFQKHLADARKSLTEAWKLKPALPLASARMMQVALGESGIAEMREWFDRSVEAQIDYEPAWREMRWGLRPRWFGDEDAMLAFGITAANTKRYDTDVPRMLFDSISDLESEQQLEPGQHLYYRDDIWPRLSEMYRGYIARPKTDSRLAAWRTSYAVVAYFAGKFDVAREQFEALNWEPKETSLSGWGVDATLMPLEVAARTGLAKDRIARAETQRNAGETTASLAIYREIANATNADTRTLEFVRHRVAALEMEQRLEKGEWVDFLPKDNDDPNWVFARGTANVLPDGALEVASGPLGHLIYSRVRIGEEFEVKGSFEVVSSSTHSFQGGLVMGMPDLESHEWNAFRMKRNRDESEVASYSRGWGRNGFTHPIKLNDVTNSFDFTYQNALATAFVNDEKVLSNTRSARELRVNEDNFLVGLGAYNDVNNTVIRYRQVQVRKLIATVKPSRK